MAIIMSTCKGLTIKILSGILLYFTLKPPSLEIMLSYSIPREYKIFCLSCIHIHLSTRMQPLNKKL